MPDIERRPMPTPAAEAPRTALLRIAAAGAALVALALCHRLAWIDPGPLPRAPLFVTLLALGGGVTFLTHGLGAWIGAGVAATTGLSAAIALTVAAGPPPGSAWTFMLLSAGVTAALGFISGRRDAGSSPRGLRMPASAVSSVCGDVAADFCNWARGFGEPDGGATATRSAADARLGGAEPTWGDFDQFIRDTLRRRLGAAGVRVFHRSADGESLLLLSCRRSSRRRMSRGEPGAPSARAGLVGRVIASGEPFVAAVPERDGYCEALAAEQARPTETLTGEPTPRPMQGWKWLLPLRDQAGVQAVVAVGRVRHAAADDVAVAGAVRDLLEMEWSAVHDRQALHAAARRDRQSGMLERTELRALIRKAAEDAARDGEPFMVLVLALEGLRRLDDGGAWEQRDALIERFAEALRQRVRSDDALGRFSDDRFVVVLRRLDHALGRRIAEKLLETARDALAGAAGEGSAAQLRVGVRAGLVGGRPSAAGDGEPLLARALQLVAQAREQGLLLAVEGGGPPPGMNAGVGAAAGSGG